jgi:uncharacterized protein YgiM (DUF1202 family)
MYTLVFAPPALVVLALFAALSLATLIDPRDPALQPPAQARRGPARRPRQHLQTYPTLHAHTYTAASAPPAARQERKLHMHTQTGIRWLSIVLLALLVSGALTSLAAPAQAADGLPTAYVNTGQLNVRTGPGVGFSVVTRIDEGQAVSLLARNSAASWVKIRLPNAIEGWVNARYLRADVLLGDLPVNDTSTPAPTAVPAATGTVTAALLDLRSGPGTQNTVVVVLRQGQALTLLGRTSDSGWVKVRAGSLGEGWIPAQITVTLPGNENGVAVAPFSASVAVSALPVVGTVPVAPSGPRVSLSSVNVRPATPIYITVAGFPANRDIAAVLTSRNVPAGFVVATGRTDASGSAQLFFRQPDMWPSGAAITEASLSLAVGTTDGAVLIWNGLAYRP